MAHQRAYTKALSIELTRRGELIQRDRSAKELILDSRPQSYYEHQVTRAA